MRIYVAGGSAERLTVVRPLMDRLRAHGHVITRDWTACEGYDRDSTEDERRRWAEYDLDGVYQAEVVWLVTPAEKSEGAACEMGAALSRGMRVIVSGPHARRNIFALVAREIYDTHEAALAALCSGPRQTSVDDDARWDPNPLDGTGYG